MLPYSEAALEVEPPKNMFPLLELPVELVLCISDHLLEEDKICLALTCKDLFTLLGVKSRAQLMQFTRQELFIRLEKEIPGVWYCHFCNGLIPFDKDGRNSKHGNFMTYDIPAGTSLGQAFLRSMRFPSSTYRLPYFRARLATNYHIIGPRHGIPPSNLSHQLPDVPFSYIPRPEDIPLSYRPQFRDDIYTLLYLADVKVPSQVCHRESWTAKVVKDELFLSSTHNWMHSGADNQALQNYLMHRYRKVCMHTIVGQTFLDKINLRTIDVRSPSGLGHHITGSCKYCLTDWDASVEWISPFYGWMITVTTYHDMGSCRSPYHWKWQAMTIGDRETKNRDKLPGAVKSGWLGESSEKLLPIRPLSPSRGRLSIR